MADSFFFRARRGLSPELEEARVAIEKIARGYGLDFFETIFEMCDFDEINMLASYGGFPTRYPHWRWGMEYLEMQKGYEYGLHKIYEMVINTDPSYAYLLDNNMMVDQKLVMAHVFGHVDFFKNNLWFAPTNRKMLDQMANHAVRVRRIINEVGQDQVEAWIDICLSLDNLIDPHSLHMPAEAAPAPQQDIDHRLPASDYMDPYINPPHVLEAERERHRAQKEQAQGFPASPQKDVLLFLLQHARMQPWQRDILQIVRDEALYFVPQGQTKIMNEGWASYWHTTMMTQDILTAAELIDYADHHSGTVATRPGQLNPYKLGLELFRHIEERWNKGRFGRDWMDTTDPRHRASWDTGAMLGRQKIFEVRHTHNDITFIDEFLDEEFVREHGLFVWQKDPRTGKVEVQTEEFKQVKQQLLFMLSNRGQPRLAVTNANHANRGELVLRHDYEGLDIKLEWAELTLGNLARVWGRPVHLETALEGKATLLSHDGQEFTQSKREEVA
ncbi:MAG: SpoVR family protein [Myxococcota bacterium]|nr:SpoVR family protein [Myxococcota bacterium]